MATKNKKNPTKELLSAIFQKLGGLSEVAEKCALGVNGRQKVWNWDRSGFIPLKKIGPVARKLEIKVWGLNFKELQAIHGPDAPSWARVVKAYKLGAAECARILELGEP